MVTVCNELYYCVVSSLLSVNLERNFCIPLAFVGSQKSNSEAHIELVHHLSPLWLNAFRIRPASTKELVSFFHAFAKWGTSDLWGERGVVALAHKVLGIAADLVTMCDLNVGLYPCSLREVMYFCRVPQ